MHIELVLPYPGTSRMPPPYYANVNIYEENDYKNYLEECSRRLQSSFVAIPDQDEDCSIIHMKPSDKLVEKYKTLDIMEDSKIPARKDEHPDDLNGLKKNGNTRNFVFTKPKNIRRNLKLSDQRDTFDDFKKINKKATKLRYTQQQQQSKGSNTSAINLKVCMNFVLSSFVLVCIK